MTSMDNTRQKLLALVRGAAYDNTYCSSDGEPVCVISSPIVDPYLIEPFTDYLLARGVTFAEDEAPTADAVEVVRCKDCVLWKPIDDHNGKCPFLIGENQCTGAEHYCSCGERRSENAKKSWRDKRNGYL